MPFDYTGSFSGSFTGDLISTNGVISSSAQLPSGTVSSSAQINYNTLTNKPTTISAFQKNSITSNNTFREDTFPTISSSLATRITTEEGNVDNLQSDVSALQTASGSFSTRVTNIEGAGYLTSASAAATGFGSGGSTPAGTISSSQQIIDLGFSTTDSTGSEQTLSFDDSTNALSISNGNSVDLSSLSGGGGGGAGLNITASDEGTPLSKMVRSFDFVGNAVTATNTGNAITVTVNTGSLKEGIISGSEQLPSGLISASNQITITESQISDLGSYLTSVPAGTVSGSTQITFSGISGTPSGLVSSSNQILPITTSSITDFPTEVSRSAASFGFGTGGGSVPSGTISSSAQLPSGIISGSEQLPSGIVSSSAQITALGFGGGGGSTDITALNNFTGSANTSITALNTFTGSAISNDQTSSMTVATASYALYAVSASHEIVTEVSSSHAINADTASFVQGYVQNSQTSSMSVATSSFTTGFSIFDGNRIVSNTDLPTNIYNVNFGTSGSLTQFIEKVFFPNTVPSISTNGFTIGEFVASGSVIGTATATDAEGQSITFREASSYTDDFFKIASNGQITLNTKSTSSMNTDNTPGSGSHAFPIEAVDTFSGVGSKTIYIRVTPNTAPVWRQTSVGGSIVTTFTQSLNENSVAANNKVRVYFTDAEGDSITIGSGSAFVSSSFSFTKESTYVQLNQITSSLDYEVTPIYSFVLTASDEHYGSGDDTEAITYLPFQVAVTDNVGPTVNDQVLGTINENTSDGTSVGSITATDPEGDTIVFSNFTLKEASLDGGSNITSSLGGNSLYDPHQDPFQMDSSGNVTRKAGVYLNSDVANQYIYQVTVKDTFNTTSDTGLITINIADDAQSTVLDNWDNLYIIESATSGDEIKISSNGRTGDSAVWSSGVSQRWEVKSTGNLIGLSSTTGSSTTLRLASDLSGSAYSSGSTIAVELTASENGFETTKQFINQNIAVVINNAPVPSFSNTSANLNTNGARSGSTITTVSFTDAESDSLNHGSFTFTDPSGQLNSIKSGDSYLIQATNNLSASVYEMTASIKDTHGFRVGTTNHSLTIAQASTGSLGGDVNSHIIESAESGSVVRDDTGFNGGNPSQLTVSYSPQYNSAAVQSFTSSNAAIAIDNSGNLTLGVHISGSSTGSGDTISSTITFRDQFDNIGSGSITVNVFANQAPTATFTDIGANLTASISSGTGLVSMSISDTESDTPFSASLSGLNAGNLELVPQNANSSSYVIKSTGTINGAVTYSYTASIKDNFDKTNTFKRTLTILDPIANTYVYGWDGGSAASEAAAIASLGDTGADGIDIVSGSVIAHLQSGSIGSSFNPSYVGGTMTKIYEGRKTTLSDSNSTGLSSFGFVNFSSGGSKRLIVVFPSASNQFGKPRSMYDGVPPDGVGTEKEYYVYAKDAAIPGTIGTGVYYFETETAVEGYSNWGMIFAEGENTNNSRYYLMPDSASAP